MALAFLCQSLTELPLYKRGDRSFRYIPFIVDHKAREGSTEEALLVSKRLKELLGEWSCGQSLRCGIDIT